MFDFIGAGINYEMNTDGVIVNENSWITTGKPYYIGDVLYTEDGAYDITWDFTKAKEDLAAECSAQCNAGRNKVWSTF